MIDDVNKHRHTNMQNAYHVQHLYRLLLLLLVPRLLPIMVLLLAVWVLRRPLAQPVAVLARGAARGLPDVGARRPPGQQRGCAAHCALTSRRWRVYAFALPAPDHRALRT